MGNFSYPAVTSSGDCSSCGRTRRVGDWPGCPHTRGGGGNRIRAIHTSERTVVYSNPRTGEVRFPARNDQPIPQVYAKQGFERQELESARDVAAFEKRTGRIHERSWCDPGSATAEKSLNTGLEDPKITGLDQGYGDRELIGSVSVGVRTE